MHSLLNIILENDMEGYDLDSCNLFWTWLFVKSFQWRTQVVLLGFYKRGQW